MKKLLLWLCLFLPLAGIAQTSTETIFRLDLRQTEIPEDNIIVTIASNITNWVDVELEDGDNGVWRKNFNITHPENENVDVYYRYRVESIIDGNVSLLYETSDEACFESGSNDNGYGGEGKIRYLSYPEDVNQTTTSGEWKTTACWDTCGDDVCPPEACEEGLISSLATQQCLPGGQALIVFEWQTECTPEFVLYSNADGAGPFQYGVNPEASNFGVYAGNGQMPPNWSVEHQLVVQFTDGSQSEPIVYTPNPCIEGCTDPNAESYNPWATIDDGTCSGTECDTSTTHQISMEITFDNWPNEIGWSITSGAYGVLQEELPGAYDFNDQGQTYIYEFCVDQNAGFEFIITDTFGDGLAGSTSGGSIDGNVVIRDCNGDVIWELPNPNFGYTGYSGQQFGIICEVTEDVYGCTDPAYQSYNPEATIDDGSCTELHIVGCTDENSINFNPEATKQELIPACDYILKIRDAAGDGWGNSWIGVAQGDQILGTYTMGPGNMEQSFPLVLSSSEEVTVYYFEVGNPQTSPEELNFQTLQNQFLIVSADDEGEVLLQAGQNPFADNGQGALQNYQAPFFENYSALPFCGTICIPIVEGCTTEGSLNYNPDANVDDGTCIPYIEGCMNEFAFNYNPEATVDDGSCIEVVVGCMDPASFNYNPEANTPGDCIAVVEGCMDASSFNYNELANVDDGSCIPIVEGCMDVNSINYNPEANTDDGSCIPIVEGCTNPDSFNFNVDANVDDGSCIPVVYGCTNPDSFNYNPDANVDNGTCEEVVFGCTNPDSFNYNPDANTDNGTCVDIVYGCTDNTALNYNPEANTDDGSCIPILAGCTDPDSFNYNPLANTDDGSCIPIVYGCTDPNAFNYNPDANTEDFTCVDIIYGCMDPASVNYNPEANVDNGTCITAIVGCTDPESYNYNPEANVSDPEACLYDAGCITGPGEPYWLNNQCYAWVIDVDNYCCDNEWDPVCQEMYNYCENGWPEGMDINGMFNRSFNRIVVYPNPTSDKINIDSTVDITYSVYDITGRIIIKDSNKNEVDLSNVESGVYFLNIRYEDQIFNKRIIKE